MTRRSRVCTALRGLAVSVVLAIACRPDCIRAEVLEYEGANGSPSGQGSVTHRVKVTRHYFGPPDWEIVTETAEDTYHGSSRIDLNIYEPPILAGDSRPNAAHITGTISLTANLGITRTLDPLEAKVTAEFAFVDLPVSCTLEPPDPTPVLNWPTDIGIDAFVSSGTYGPLIAGEEYLEIETLKLTRRVIRPLSSVDLGGGASYSGHYEYWRTHEFHRVPRVNKPRVLLKTPADVDYGGRYSVTVTVVTASGVPAAEYQKVQVSADPPVYTTYGLTGDHGAYVGMTNGVGTFQIQIWAKETIEQLYGPVPEVAVWARNFTAHINSPTNKLFLIPLPEDPDPGDGTGAYPVSDGGSAERFFSWNPKGADAFFFGSPTTNPVPHFAELAREWDIPRRVFLDTEAGKTYYWQVASEFSDIGMVTGAVWRFNTEAAVPRDIFPPHGAEAYLTSRTDNVRLEWDNNNDFDVEFDMVFQPWDGPGSTGKGLQTFNCKTQEWFVVPYPLEINRAYAWSVTTRDISAVDSPPPVAGHTAYFTVLGIIGRSPNTISVTGEATISNPYGTPTYDRIWLNETRDFTIRDGFRVTLHPQAYRGGWRAAAVETATEHFSGGSGGIEFSNVFVDGNDFKFTVRVSPAHGAEITRVRQWEDRGVMVDVAKAETKIDSEVFASASKDASDFLWKEVKEGVALTAVGLVPTVGPYLVGAYWYYDTPGDIVDVARIADKYGSSMSVINTTMTRTFHGCMLKHGPPPGTPPSPPGARVRRLAAGGDSPVATECVVSMSSNSVTVHVFEGDYTFSDPGEQKSVHLVPGTMTSWVEGGLPAAPVAFDVNNPPVEPWSARLEDLWADVGAWSFDEGAATGWSGDGMSTWTVSNETYTVTGDGADRYAYSLLDPVYTSYWYSVEARKTAGDATTMDGGYGVLLRHADSNNFCEVRINAAAEYEVTKRVAGVASNLVVATVADVLRPGINSRNKLSVLDEWGILKIYANGVLLETIDGLDLPPGRVGVFAMLSATSSPPDSVEFDNVVLVGDTRPPPAYVSPGGSHTPPYETWETAATNIQTAVEFVGGGGRVVVGEGRYRLTARINVDYDVVIRAAGEPGTVIVDGQHLTSGFGLYHSNAVVEGFTVVNGRTLGLGGGGVYIREGTLLNTVVSNCVASSRGGGIYCFRSGRVEGCTVVANSAKQGGGICLYEGGEVTASRVTGNAASQGSSDRNGGGIFLYRGGTVLHTTVDGNSAVGDGGGLYFYEDGGTVTACVVEENLVQGWGGGAHFRSGGHVADSTLSSNRASFGGGAFIHTDGRLSDCEIAHHSCSNGGGGVYVFTDGQVEGCALRENTALAGAGALLHGGGVVERCTVVSNGTETGGANYGGGVYAYEGGTVRGSLFIHNRADYGGGVHVRKVGTIQNCTIVSNTAVVAGGGAGCYLGGTVENSIMYYNQADNYAFWTSNTITYSHCNTTPEPSGAGVLTVSTLTGAPGFVAPGLGDYYLSTRSPGIDSGLNAAWMSSGMDLYGYPRILNGTVDRGAYEYNPDQTDTDGDGLTDVDENRIYGTNAEKPDCDDDGMVDGDEIRAGTDPWNRWSIFAVEDIERDRGTGDVVFSWASVEGKLYSVWRAESLLFGTPSRIDQQVPATPPLNTYTDNVGVAASRFYYISVEP